MTGRTYLFALSLFFLFLLSGCSSAPAIRSTQAFSVATNQNIVPVLPFASTLVPAQLSEAVFNDYVDLLNDKPQNSELAWFAIVKEDVASMEKILPPSHIYVSGELWSFIENAGCCSTELRIKSRLRFLRVKSRELLWEADIQMDSFFEHDSSTLTVEREKIGKRLSAAMAKETQKALQNARRITLE